MKLRHSLLILISLPIACLLITVVPLGYLFAKVDRNAKQEAVAKRVVGLVQEIRSVIAVQVMNVSGVSVSEKHFTAEQLSAPSRILRTKTRELKKLVSDDPAMTRVAERLQVNTVKHADGWAELGEVYKPREQNYYLSEFLDKAEMLESMKILYDQLENDLTQITAKYGKVAREFEPQEVKNREDLRNLTMISSVLAILIVLCSYVVINRTTLQRLQILMSNIQNFSAGQIINQPLSGKDELADLDRAFREMSEERNRLEEMRQAMRAMVNHDLRSPLTSINICLELLIKKHGQTLTPDIVVQLKRMYGESQRLVRLASTLLDVDKLEDGMVEVHQKQMTAVELVKGSIEAVEGLAGRKSIKLIENADPDAIVLGDEDKSIQVLVNFLSNAIKFSPQGSTIEIATSIQNAGFIKFSVLDQGAGVPQDKAPSLFSKFKQFDQPDEVKKEGSGLGLYICKMLVETQGGQLGYTPREGGGSCFWFELPDADQLEQA